ncbi:MAG: aspartate-semialdehyde dehydrogenase [Candidatus Theseobacter exili]|nr:aspartate-semialdehyde dehydrogenase [Candidatus Theseobacter exili]
MKKLYNIAVVGATGAVGAEMLNVLKDRNFPIANLRLLASARSKGKELKFKDKVLKVEELREDSFEGIDIALFSAGASRSKEYAPHAVKSGALVIDNSSAFRMDPDVPLVVPEVNPEDVSLNKGIVANPNCSTIQMVVVLAPIHRAVGIRRVVVSTYQAVSGTGLKAIQELEKQVEDLSNGQPVRCEVYPHQIAYNVIPHVDVFLDNGYTREEIKMVNETRKILHDDNLAVSATCVRVPVFRAHSEAVNLELLKELSVEDARKLLSEFPGIKVVDEPLKNDYPLALDASGKYDVLVGRIRKDSSVRHGLDMWIVADQLLKGAALNAVQIAEIAVDQGL